MERKRSAHAASTAAGRVSAFTDFYDAHVEEVYRFVHRRCRDHGLAEDITQETFMEAVRRIDEPGTLSVGWLLTVARNRLLDVVRRETRYEQKLRLVGADDADDDRDQLVERLLVEGALSQLRSEHRLVLTLHYLDGLTVPAMADQLDRSVKSVEGLITRARREFRSVLDAAGNEQTGGGHG